MQPRYMLTVPSFIGPRVQRDICTYGVSNDYAEGLQSLHVANGYKHVYTSMSLERNRRAGVTGWE
jgi:hypothetical protein